MSKGYRRSLFILSASLLLLFAVSASAQIECGECDPYSNHCSDPCLHCQWYTQDGCGGYTERTCGGFGNSNCLADDCDPYWTETGRVEQGTYGAGNWNSCNHHSVQWVTLTDVNQCNTNSTYWTQNYCDNVIDGSKNGGWYPDCCDGYPSALFTCNHYHSCTG